jgi:hypothetical protein
MTDGMAADRPLDGDVLVADRDVDDELDDWSWPDEADPGDGSWPPEDPVEREQRERSVRVTVDWLVVAACIAFTFFNLHPSQILSSAVPAGGDMGAHVWGPAFLRDHLLTDGRLSGWTPDWYAGFPAYQFYMVLPSLLIVALDVGLFGGWTMVIPLAASAGLVVASRRVGPGWRRWCLVGAAATVGILGAELPYGTAFKLVTVLGVLSLPACSYAFGRLADLAFPGPALLAVASVVFLFDQNFTIYGGNVASTLAGEFAFSISLSLALLYLGFVLRGLRTGKHRATAAVLLALTGLCHLIPAFFVLAATIVIALLRRPVKRTFVWLAWVLPVGGLVSAFWVLPFAWQRAYVNDMGWEKLPHATAENDFRSIRGTLLTFDGETYWKYLIPRTDGGAANDLRWVLALACVGIVLSIAFRIRLGIVLAALVAVSAVAFVMLGEGRLWNARLLPFYYLCLYFLAAVGVAEVGRTITVLVAADPDRPGVIGPAVTAGVGTLVALVGVALPLRTLPFGQERLDGSYSWLFLENGVEDGSFVPSWADWNYSGYVGKDAYPEYRDLVTTMRDIGEEHGCGKSFWEYEKSLNRYGTPMALMLLPHWTDGCIGSMEGLFFEASATTPFHFLTQVELSAAPSAAQRDLPYGGFDLDRGVRHLQLMGVRYYLASSAEATTAARAHPDLNELATSGPWVIFEVADSEQVEALDTEPAVLEGQSNVQHEWICDDLDANKKCAGPAISWYLDESVQDVMLASSGPDEWQRVDREAPDPVTRRVRPAEVSNIELGVNEISFDVDEPGTPVLIKESYFPNWEAKGAKGPYRVAPNLMVVVPTEEHVELSYGREPVEWVGMLLTLVGIGLVVFLALQPPLPPPARRPRPEGDVTGEAAAAWAAPPPSTAVTDEGDLPPPPSRPPP